MAEEKIRCRIHQETLGNRRAEYGEEIASTLSRQLTATHGRGWSARHLRLCIRFAQVYPELEIVHTLCAELSWSHLRLVAAVDDPLKRQFYAELCRLEGWSVRQLQERMQSLLFERSAISRQPEETIRHDLQSLRDDGRPSPALLLKDHYILDFLGLNDRYSRNISKMPSCAKSSISCWSWGSALPSLPARSGCRSTMTISSSTCCSTTAN